MLRRLETLLRRLWPLYRVSGYSLWPLYEDGDYVLALHPSLIGGIRPGDIVVFRHPAYGLMIKRVERVLPESNALYVVGTHDRSTDSRNFGAIDRQAVIGKVVWRIQRSRRP